MEPKTVITGAVAIVAFALIPVVLDNIFWTAHKRDMIRRFGVFHE